MGSLRQERLWRIRIELISVTGTRSGIALNKAKTQAQAQLMRLELG
jgi:hypothetical protein